MSPLATLPVSTGTMLALMRYLEQTAADLDLCGIADDAIIDWLNRRRAESERTARPVLHGYQWKSLFLPEGTRLRRWSCSTQDYAEVIGDDLVHEGLPTSPNRFVAACAGSVRNAWQEISVLMPGATTWNSPATCAARSKPRRSAHETVPRCRSRRLIHQQRICPSSFAAAGLRHSRIRARSPGYLPSPMALSLLPPPRMTVGARSRASVVNSMRHSIARLDKQERTRARPSATKRNQAHHHPTLNPPSTSPTSGPRCSAPRES